MQEPVQNGQRPTTQLDFNQAMKDFTTMFPEMDRDVIEEVLRANQGAVDATIDQLLAMSTDNLNEALRLDLEKTDGNPDVTKHCTSPLRINKKWAPPHLGPLPPTFLRLTSPGQCEFALMISIVMITENILRHHNTFIRVSQLYRSKLDQVSYTMDIINSCINKFETQLESYRKAKARKKWIKNEKKMNRALEEQGCDTGEDERIAMFLQNEEFLSELRINEDFLLSLDDDLGDRHDTDAFKDRLRHMGKVSKNKFTQLARVFQRRKKGRSSKGLLDQASSDGLLLGGDSLSAERDDTSSGQPSNSPSPSQGHRS